VKKKEGKTEGNMDCIQEKYTPRVRFLLTKKGRLPQLAGVHHQDQKGGEKEKVSYLTNRLSSGLRWAK